MRLLITGASGFVGRRLVRAARSRWPAAQVCGMAGPDQADGVDVTNAAAMCACVAALLPTHIVHLAAVAAVSEAARAPRVAFEVNLGGTLNMLEALRSGAPEAFLLHISSAEVYGRSLLEAAGTPVGERALLQPLNAYASSKAAADLMVQAAAAQGLSAAVVRPFNHIGGGQSEAFVAPAFAAQIARAEAGLQPPVISVGRLEDGRDFLAVDDVVSAYLDLLERSGQASGEIFNVASGQCIEVGDLLQRLLAMSRISLSVQIDPARVRSDASGCYTGDASRLRGATGWEPRSDINAALAEVLDEQRSRTAAMVNRAPSVGA